MIDIEQALAEAWHLVYCPKRGRHDELAWCPANVSNEVVHTQVKMLAATEPMQAIAAALEAPTDE